MEHRAVLGHGAQVYVVENRSCPETKLRELVSGYQAVMVELVNHVADLDIVFVPVEVGTCSPASVSRLCPRSRIATFACEPSGALDAMDSLEQSRTRTSLPIDFEQVLGHWPSRFSVGT